MSDFTSVTGADGVAVITWDVAGKSMNVMSTAGFALLSDLVELYAAGLDAPLPLPRKTASEYARIREEDKSVAVLRPVLERSWEQERDPAFELCFGAGLSLSGLERQPSVPTEERYGLHEPSRFGSLARRVWSQLLQNET